MQHETSTAPDEPGCFRFGEYCLDESRGALLWNGNSVALRPKSYDVLAYLLRHAGHLVSREQILDAVWENAAVSENSIGQCLSEIRRGIKRCRSIADQDGSKARNYFRGRRGADCMSAAR